MPENGVKPRGPVCEKTAKVVLQKRKSSFTRGKKKKRKKEEEIKISHQLECCG